MTTTHSSTTCGACGHRLEGADYYFDVAVSLTAFVDHWAWAMAETPEGGNLSREGFEGLGRLMQHLRAVLEQCQAALAATRRPGTPPTAG
jgi:hypothetical protein